MRRKGRSRAACRAALRSALRRCRALRCVDCIAVSSPEASPDAVAAGGPCLPLMRLRLLRVLCGAPMRLGTPSRRSPSPSPMAMIRCRLIASSSRAGSRSSWPGGLWVRLLPTTTVHHVAKPARCGHGFSISCQQLQQLEFLARRKQRALLHRPRRSHRPSSAEGSHFPNFIRTQIRHVWTVNHVGTYMYVDDGQPVSPACILSHDIGREHAARSK